MALWQRIFRLVLIAGLVPALIAAGLPDGACHCLPEEAQAAHGGCCSSADGNSCCGGECHCCSHNAGKNKDDGTDAVGCCHNPGQKSADIGKKTNAPSLGCHCAQGSMPQPAAPAPPSVELTASLDLPAPLDRLLPAPRPLPASACHTRSTQLPTADLPTTLCTLLI